MNSRQVCKWNTAATRDKELICANGKLDSGMKFTSPEFFFPFVQSVNQPVCPCK